MAKQIKVREDNYFAVQGWMVTELKLKGNGKMDPMDLELAIKDTSRLLTRLQDMQVQEEQDDKS